MTLVQKLLFGPKRRRKYQYRYRADGLPTYLMRKRFDFIISRLGQITEVRGYRYYGRYSTTHEAVMLKGTKGTARLSGLCWGYGGEGPSGLVELLLRLGVPKEQAQDVAFKTPRGEHFDLGTDWKLVLGWARVECPPHINPLLTPALASTT